MSTKFLADVANAHAAAQAFPAAQIGSIGSGHRIPFSTYSSGAPPFQRYPLHSGAPPPSSPFPSQGGAEAWAPETFQTVGNDNLGFPYEAPALGPIRTSNTLGSFLPEPIRNVGYANSSSDIHNALGFQGHYNPDYCSASYGMGRDTQIAYFSQQTSQAEPSSHYTYNTPMEGQSLGFLNSLTHFPPSSANLAPTSNPYTDGQLMCRDINISGLDDRRFSLTSSISQPVAQSDSFGTYVTSPKA